MSKKTPPHAIVIGLDSITGLQTARILQQHGIPVIGIAKDPGHFACRTRSCEKVLIVNTDNKELIDLLHELRPSFLEKPVLFPCSDSNVLVLSRYRDHIDTEFHLILPDANVIEMMVDKVKFYEYARDHGLPIPETYILFSREDVKKAADRMVFPAVLKPPYRPERWRMQTRDKAFKIMDAEQLFSIYDKCHTWADVLILQKWVEGEYTNHVTCNCYFNRSSQPLITFTSRKLRQWPHTTGQGCFGEAYHDEVVASETIRLYRQVNFSGLAYLEMKRDDTSGNYFIIEPNVGRPTGRSATAEANGVELMYTMYCDLLNLPLPENRHQTTDTVKWIYLRQDIQSALFSWLRGELTLWAWVRSLRGPKWYAVFSWKDPAPFFHDLRRAATVFINSYRNRKHEKTTLEIPSA